MINEKKHRIEGKIRIVPVDEDGNADYSKSADLQKSFVPQTKLNPLDYEVKQTKCYEIDE